VGTVASAAIGRVLYLVALTRTNNDNAFVTMFFLLVPGLSALLSWPMSWFVSDLAFASGPLFFVGLGLVAISLAVFSLSSLKQATRPA
jgi:hypothetical protein